MVKQTTKHVKQTTKHVKQNTARRTLRLFARCPVCSQLNSSYGIHRQNNGNSLRRQALIREMIEEKIRTDQIFADKWRSLCAPRRRLQEQIKEEDWRWNHL